MDADSTSIHFERWCIAIDNDQNGTHSAWNMERCCVVQMKHVCTRLKNPAKLFSA